MGRTGRTDKGTDKRDRRTEEQKRRKREGQKRQGRGQKDRRGEEFSELLLDAARNSFTAVSFLAAAGLLVAPAACPKCGKAWKLHTSLTRSQPYFWCWSRTRLLTSRAKRRRCNTKRTWHFYCPLAKKVPKMLPGCTAAAIECAAFETDLHRNTIAACYDTLRLLVVNFMDQVSTNQKLGGPGKVVCLDETHITKRKCNKAGFGGRRTLGPRSSCCRAASWMVSTTAAKQPGRPS